MAYSTYLQVRAITDTDITDAEITDLIVESDAYLDALLDTGSLSATILQLLSRLYTSFRCMLKDPNARSIGGYSENRAETLRLMKAEFEMLTSVLGGGGISFVAACEELS